MMKDVKVVIGANFGDEGKGLMTAYFAGQAAAKSQSCLVVCHNGSAQKGHTVEWTDGRRHIFHHLGSGTYSGGDTYCSAQFVVNPIFFRREYEEMKESGYDFTVYLNGNCRLALPCDMMINQELEARRGSRRHGSCGYGFYESVLRNRERSYRTRICDTGKLNELVERIENIGRNYCPKRMRDAGFDMGTGEFPEMILDEGILEHYLEDLDFLLQHTIIVDDRILNSYDQVIFEGEQGLLLDEHNMEYFPHLTPSSTGLTNPIAILDDLKCKVPVEVCYVTRTYLTRHGAGRLDQECGKDDICMGMVDLTNQPNPFQGTLRYARLDAESLEKRIASDYRLAEGRDNYTRTLAVTHENEYVNPWLSGAEYHSQEKWVDTVQRMGDSRTS